MPGGRGRSERSRLFRLAGKGDFNYFFLKNLAREVSSLLFYKSTLLVNKMFSFSPSLPTTTVYLLRVGSDKQCVAVSTQFGLVSEPPQL